MAYFRAATDGCGVVHVIVFYSLADPDFGVPLAWVGGWRPGAPLPGTGSFLPGDLESAPDGTLDIIWRQNAGSGSPQGLMFSRYQCNVKCRRLSGEARPPARWAAASGGTTLDETA